MTSLAWSKQRSTITGLTSPRSEAPPYSQQRFHSEQLYHKFLNANIFNSAHCPAVISQSSLWMFGALWAVVILVVGFLFFWHAEVQYGRG